MRINHQILAAASANIGAYNFGMVIGWLSPALPQLFSPSKPIGDVTLEQSSWLAALPSFVGVTAPLMIYWANKYGRKKCLAAAAIPFVINSILVLLAEDVYTLLIGRFIAGIGVIVFFCNCTIYISEIASPEVRGRLGSFYNLLYTIGVCSAYCFGGFISYKAAAVVMAVAGSINFFALMFIPDAPIFLLKKGRKDEAIKSIAWLKQVPIDSPVVKNEIEILQNIIDNDTTTTLQSLKLLFTSRPLSYGFIICLLIFFGQSYTGMFAIHGYSVTIFTEGGSSNLTPEQASVVYACIQICGALSTTTLIEKLGRKVLLLGSFMGVCLSMFVMGVYFDLKSKNAGVENYPWIPVLALSFCVYIYTVGAGGIPFILLAEMLPQEVKVVATILAMQIISCNSFLVLKFFEPLSVKLGRHVIFYFFSSCCVISILFIIFFINETKGKSNQDILDMNYGFKAKYKFNSKNKKHEIF